MACVGLNIYHSAFGKSASHFHYCTSYQDEPLDHCVSYQNDSLYITLSWIEAWLTATLAFMYAMASDDHEHDS